MGFLMIYECLGFNGKPFSPSQGELRREGKKRYATQTHEGWGFGYKPWAKAIHQPVVYSTPLEVLLKGNEHEIDP